MLGVSHAYLSLTLDCGGSDLASPEDRPPPSELVDLSAEMSLRAEGIFDMVILLPSLDSTFFRYSS